MVNELMRVGLTLPISTHEAMRQLSFQRTADAGKVVTLTDLYSEGVHRLTAQIEAGEDIVFPVQPRGSVRRVSLRLPSDVCDLLTKYCHLSSQSAIVAKGAQVLLQSDE
jgi:hypothetical protein